MFLPGVHIETLLNPALYTAIQIERAARLAYALGRGRFVLLEPPRGAVDS